jgi:DNA-binding Xre family transcriptional regulator
MIQNKFINFRIRRFYTFEAICKILQHQPGDILEYKDDE